MLTLDETMLLRSMALFSGPVSAAALARHWSPVWQVGEVERILTRLARSGDVQRVGRGAGRYVPRAGVTP